VIPHAAFFYDHSLAAYSAQDPALTIPDGYTLAGRIQSTAGMVFGYVATSDDGVMVAFRGTEHVSEWLSDFEPVIAPGALVFANGVHAGFQAIYNSIRDNVIALTAKAIDTRQRLFITGHSLGAALATIFAIDAARAFIIQPEGCVFASPRVGFPGFAMEFDVAVPSWSRVENHWDVVPHVPISPMFKHVGSAIRVNGNFTLDLETAHSLPLSYKPGLAKLAASSTVTGT
jgi:triacylglycerol lipase